MENKKKFIMKSVVTVCLLAVLSIEGLFLYCHYIKHISTIQYVYEKLSMIPEWFFHSGTQTANAQSPSHKESLKIAPAAPELLISQTAVYAIQNMVEDNSFVIPEAGDVSISSNISSNTSIEADPAYPETATADVKKDDPTATPKTGSAAGSDPLETAEAADTKTTAVHDLIKRQEADGLTPNQDSRIQLGAESILQYPELPTGCEVTSLTMALRFAGYDVSKEILADQYLDKTSPGTVSYKTAFWGDPRQSESFGCYAPVIVNAANKYLAEQESTKQAYDLTGTPLDDILEEIRMGCPVIVWGSMYINEEIVFSYGWDIDGETVTWPSNEHCMLLIGFDTEDNSVIVCDPLEGTVSYDKNAFQHHYDTLEQQAIVIY